MLLVLSAVMLLVVGARVLLPDPAGHADRCSDRRDSAPLIVGLAFGVGLLTGLLANGGGFLLVPAFILLLGLSTAVAAGTSLVVAAVLSVPTLLVHWSLGHIDWRIALLFGLGSVPGTYARPVGGPSDRTATSPAGRSACCSWSSPSSSCSASGAPPATRRPDREGQRLGVARSARRRTVPASLVRARWGGHHVRPLRPFRRPDAWPGGSAGRCCRARGEVASIVR